MIPSGLLLRNGQYSSYEGLLVKSITFHLERSTVQNVDCVGINNIYYMSSTVLTSLVLDTEGVIMFSEKLLLIILAYFILAFPASVLIGTIIYRLGKDNDRRII